MQEGLDGRGGGGGGAGVGGLKRTQGLSWNLRAAADDVTDAANALTAFIIVRLPSHEAAARMFEGRPHFTVFPGEAVEVMPVLAVDTLKAP